MITFTRNPRLADTLTRWNFFAVACCIALSQFFAASARADFASAVANVASEPAATNQAPHPKPYCRPDVDHSMLILDDGRMLVAGGQSISNNHADHPVGDNSEIWDPQTGLWQVLGDDLRFEPNQRAYANQLADGRILFFLVRDQDEHGKPGYQAILWNPATLKTEKLAVNIKPKSKSDIVVMPDGRVLIVNGIDASADVWDSRSGTTKHNEVAELENLRWRGFLLKTQQVLLIATFSDEALASTKSADYSAVLLWDIKSDGWKPLTNLPVPFHEDSTLAELENSILYARVANQGYGLPTLAKDMKWEISSNYFLPTPDCGNNLPSNNAISAVAAASAAPPTVAVAPTATVEIHEADTAWWTPYQDALQNNISIILILLILFILFYASSRWESQPWIFRNSTRLISQVLAIFFISYLILLFIYTYVMN